MVEWPAEQPVTEPVMIGTASTRGASFTNQARIISDRSRGAVPLCQMPAGLAHD
ncbi:MAG TPA: hypothetical protein VKP69_08530 [Isosphaeraceae bacterium]|nr:hypothetical protein [Isosphaeraceae bacterium]